MKKDKKVEAETKPQEEEILEDFIVEDQKTLDEETKYNKDISNLKKINNELIDKLQRSLAEFDNFRKRTIKEKSQMYDDGVKDTIEKILPTIDNFERAITSFPDKEDNFYKGFDMIYKQLNSVLFEMGVEVIETIGKEFDINCHNAVAHVKDDAYGDNEVIEEIQKGYKYKDKIIRCSMVKVAN